MKETGIVRKIDNLGRVVLPIEMRRALEIEVKDPIEIYVEGENVVLRKYRSACILCGKELDLVGFKGKKVCRNCIEQSSQKL